MALVTVIRRKNETDVSLVALIHGALAEHRVKHPLREDDWIRVSGIGSMCPREEVLVAKHDIMREEDITGDQGINFALGHAVHWMMQNRAVGPTGLLVGAWRCTWCGEIYGGRERGLVAMPTRCIRCGAVAGDAPRVNGRPEQGSHPNAFLYVEEFVGNDEWKIGGHPDGYLAVGEDVWLLEFKSANDRNFYKYKDSPDFVHVIQAQCYLWLTGLKKAKIVYFNKNGAKGTFIVEHDMNFDPEVIERVHQAIKQIRGGIVGGIAPERMVCADYSCPRAIGCKARDYCFEIKT
jgi:hypothetical protein